MAFNISCSSDVFFFFKNLPDINQWETTQAANFMQQCKATMVFFSVSGDKKTNKKKTSSFRDKKYFSGYVFFCLFFVVLINFFFK